MHDLRFSALQRAENSSIPLHRQFRSVLEMFQCSSASRKFLNHTVPKPQIAVSSARFSALQRAENSSIKSVSLYADSAPKFQCSSASRKFLNRSSGLRMRPSCWVSVLFSEPKIPQLSQSERYDIKALNRFSALQRAENSSIERRKSLCPAVGKSFSALQRAENSSMLFCLCVVRRGGVFQCSSASRKFLNS